MRKLGENLSQDFKVINIFFVKMRSSIYADISNVFIPTRK